MSGWARLGRRWCRRGFTLIELLVVITIILLVSVSVMPLFLRNTLAISEAARLVQGGLVAARDAAVHKNAPCGVRLVRDPGVPVRRLATGQIDPSSLLYADRLIPLEPGPSYSEGMVSISPVLVPPKGFPPPYPGSTPAVYPYPYYVLMVEECPIDRSTGLANPTTSWFWNVRIGDKLRFGDSGPLYTVVGPMTISTSELSVNCGTPGVDFPGKKSPLIRYFKGKPIEVEFLFLVNGQDDDGDGFIDEGFDGVDNNQDGLIDDLAEWEVETWDEARASLTTSNVSYTIVRRPVPSSASRTVALPSSVVIDLTSWSTTAERSRLPVNPYTGDVDIVLSPSGQLVPTTIYSCPSSFKISNSFLHFWIADRGDLFDPDPASIPQLPLPRGVVPDPLGRELKNDSAVVTLNARTGQITSSTPTEFDTANVGKSSYNPGMPFVSSQR